jgi:hypothetical protein
VTWPTPDPSAALSAYQAYVVATVEAGEGVVHVAIVLAVIFGCLALFSLGVIAAATLRRG